MKIAEKVENMLLEETPLKVLREKRKVFLPRDSKWTEIAEELGCTVDILHKLNPKLKHVKKSLFKGTIILAPGKALEVSYTEEGLKWATDALGRSLYYDGKRPNHDSNLHSKNVYVENFIPRNHYMPFTSLRYSKYLQKSEFNACDKALRLLYVSSFDYYQ